ncbi:hypothetical protein VIBNISFn118_820020 [Vibrio nigripulchritudo SFn118]|nr:hypothetical protein VIBNIMADA3021_940007 [Vibrio nigripulchritudo MADA3021]CCN73375.1 hypothetical protein VIBNISFn118_820020 [Vibrio nigripulchritudo SFn118]
MKIECCNIHVRLLSEECKLNSGIKCDLQWIYLYQGLQTDLIQNLMQINSIFAML